MPRTKLSLGLDGYTFKILYVFYYRYLKNHQLRMMDIWRWGPIEGLGWYATVKAFAYLRNNGLIRRTREHRQCHDYVISQKGIEVLYDTLLKRQKLGMTCEIAGICLEADLKTRQISVKTNLNEDTNSSQTVQIPL